MRPRRDTSKLTDADAIRYLMDRSRVDRKTGCWIWTHSCTSDGYGQIGIQWIVDRYQAKGAHRLSKMIFERWTPVGREEQIRHTCHNRPCINPGHLLTGSALDNKLDNLKDGRFNANQKLSLDDVQAIKQAHDAGRNIRDLMQYHEVSRSTIYRIINNKRIQ